MPTNDFLPFGTAVGANVSTQAEYVALAARSNGFSAGTAVSKQLNKAWRQSSVMAATLAQFIADQSGNDVLDDGNLATIQTNLGLAIKAAIANGIPYATQAQLNAGTSTATVVAPRTLSTTIQSQAYTAFAAGGTAPNFTLTSVPAITAYVPNQRFQVTFGAAGGAAPTLNASGQGVRNLKQYNSAGNKVAAVIVANQTSDLFYDGTDFVLLDPLPPDTLVAGSGGWLGTAPQITGAISSLASSQLFAGVSPGTTDTPFANTVGMHMRFPGGLAAEIAVSINDPQGSFYYRTLGGASTGAWRTAWDNGNFNPATKISGNTCSAAGFAGGDKTQPYVQHTDSTVVSLSRRNTAQLAASGWSKNTDTGEIIQWVEYLIGDIPSHPTQAVVWPFAFPTAFINAKINFKQASTSYAANATANYIGATTSGCTVKLSNWSSGQDPALTLVIEARGY